MRVYPERVSTGLTAFAWAIEPELGLNLPGAPFALAGLLLLMIASRMT